MCAFLLAFGFYSISTFGQFIDTPGIACGTLGDNVLDNPSFEDGPGDAVYANNNGNSAANGGLGAIQDWALLAANGGAAGGWGNVFVETPENGNSPCFGTGFEPDSRSGARNVKMFSAGANFGPQLSSNLKPAAAGETWVSSIFVLSPSSCNDNLNGDDAVEVQVLFYDAGQNLIGFSTSSQFTAANADDTWQQHKAVATAPAGTAFVNLKALIINPSFGNEDNGAVHLDDASLRKVTPVAPVVIEATDCDGSGTGSVQVPIPTFNGEEIPHTNPFVPTLTDNYCAGDFSPLTFTNDFNGALDASGDYPVGTTTVSYVANDGANDSAPCALFEIVVIDGAPTNGGTMVCNDLVNISITEDGCSLVSVDAILEGDGYGCLDQFEVVRVHDLVDNCSPDAPNGFFWVGCSDVGTTITLKVIDPSTGNYCWGDAYVEDKEQPTLECDVTYTDINGNDQVGTIFNLICSEDPDDIDLPTPVDNCDRSRDMTVNLISETTTGDLCSVLTITRVYQSADKHGNKTNMCTQVINIVQPAMVTFPDDITWACDHYASYPNIIDATALNADILDEAADIDTSLLYCGIEGTQGDDVAGIDPYGVPTDLLTNGGFEMGDLTDWDTVDGCGSGTTVFTGTNYNNGLNDVSPTEGESMLVNDFSGISGAGCATVNIRHNVVLPTTGSSVLSLDYNAAWDLTCAGCLPKEAFVEIIEVGVGQLSLTRIVQANPGTVEMGSWQTYTQDLSAYAGKTLQIQIVQALAPTNPNTGHFALDNVQLISGSTTPYWLDGEDLDINYDVVFDANLLRRTGSGQPNVAGSANCKFAVVHSDQRLEACEGVDTTTTFKILRTWTVLNWCTGLTTTDVQIIKVIDKKAPTFDFEYDHDGNLLYNTELLANQSTGLGNHAECASSGIIPVPIIEDDCSGVADVRAFTPAGEGIPVYDNNGNLVGFSVPSPFLDEGEHDIIFQATDACGNSSRDTIEFEVIDGTPPTPICRELTQISVSSEEDGVAVIQASDFDEGSYDYCGPVYFKVRRMDDNCTGFTDDRRRFNDEIHFCCDDIGENVMVILRVYDVNPGLGAVSTGTQEDRSNECMIEVLVEDKVRPECIAPADVWINCDEVADNIDWDDDFVLDDLYGTATVLDNCSADLQYVSTRVNLDLCGVGTVTRTFRAEDTYGNRSIGSCRQVIMVQPVINYCITFPQDYEGECDNNNAPEDLTFVENGCDLLAVSSEEEPFNAGGPAGDECRKVIRTWKVINWCEYDGIDGPTVLSRDANGDGRIDDGEYCSTGAALVYQPNPLISYPSTGYYQWKQHVKIFDNTAPEISYDGENKFCGGDLDEDPCTGQVDMELDITELCTDALTTNWAISAFSSTFSATDFNGSDNISLRLPLGTHTARFSVTDDCGNTSQMDITFTIVDCKAPTPVCHNGLSIDVMPLSGMVELWASDFDASSFDYCSDFILRANVIEDTNGDGIITNDDYSTTLPADDFIILDCDDVANGVTMVQVWVAEQDGTEDDSCDDNQDNDYCVTFVEVQDNNGVCSGSKSVIGGKIANENNEAVENVTIEVNSGASMLNSVTTDASGEYEFLLPIGGDYSVTPMKNDDIANGVSTFDLVLISKHILNVQLLDSPYKVLAADANRSNSVSTLDLVAIRKVVLRLTNEFPNNTSWRFVEKSHIFSGNNPFATTVPELVNFNNLTVNELNANFTAIKVGDVNSDATANGILGVDDRSFNGNFEFSVEEQNFEAGEEVVVTFSADELQSVDGYQFTLKFNEKALDLVSIENGVATAENFGTAMANNGYITTSWNGTATDNEAFTVIFNAKAAGTLSNEIAVSSALTAAEAYEGVDYKNVSINFGSDVASNEFALYQNTPNPFKGETVIGFDLPKASTATLTVSDVSGKILKVVNGDFAKGHNNITLSSDELSTGVLYYQLDTEGFTKTMKMVVIK